MIQFTQSYPETRRQAIERTLKRIEELTDNLYLVGSAHKSVVGRELEDEKNILKLLTGRK